jgi:hypothetical protein
MMYMLLHDEYVTRHLNSINIPMIILLHNGPPSSKQAQ